MVVAVWAFSGRSECPDSALDGSSAIARVSNECVYRYQVATYLRDLLLSVGPTTQESSADESPLGEYFRDRNRLISEFGPENAALAALALDFALHQEALSRGYVPLDEEIMVRMGQTRERIDGLYLLAQLSELAKASDFVAFRSLIESPSASQLVRVQGEEHLVLLFEQAKVMDFSSLREGLEVQTALTESFGSDRYWNEVYVEHTRRPLANDAFRLTMVNADADWSGIVDWLDFRDMTWSGTAISLTDAAPNTLNLESVRSYMNEFLDLERDLLE